MQNSSAEEVVLGPPSVALLRTARTAGAFYLALAITGMLGFLWIRPTLFSADDPAATLAHLRDGTFLARLGVALEMALVITQAGAALWFFRVFRTVDDLAAGAIAAFGLINAIVILASAAFLATALQLAVGPADPSAVIVQLMYLISGNFWLVGNLFFGLWLIPMGVCVLRSQQMPRALGFILIVGGLGYIVSPFVTVLVPSARAVGEALPMPATIGEFWMIGYLLIFGVNRRRR